MSGGEEILDNRRNIEIEDEIEKEFNKLKITTATHIVELNGRINYLELFPLLETVTDSAIMKKYDGKRKIPYLGLKKTILSATTHGFTRGIKKKSGNFPHSIGIDLSISTKNVNLKLSDQGFQITGTKSKELTEEVVTTI